MPAALKNACSGNLSEVRRKVTAHMRDLRNTTILNTTTTKHSVRRIMGPNPDYSICPCGWPSGPNPPGLGAAHLRHSQFDMVTSLLTRHGVSGRVESRLPANDTR